jgi:hypothetical protein
MNVSAYGCTTVTLGRPRRRPDRYLGVRGRSLTSPLEAGHSDCQVPLISSITVERSMAAGGRADCLMHSGRIAFSAGNRREWPVS